MPNLDTIRFFRWGLPGWLAILGFLVFVGADLLTAPAADGPMWDALGEMFTASQSGSAVIAALLVAGAGFPLGFMVY